jgi:hypothetical protein
MEDRRWRIGPRPGPHSARIELSVVTRRKFPLCDQGTPQLEAVWHVDSECHDCCAADWGATDEHRIGPAEMMFPFMPARIEQADDFPRLGITACEIRSFVEIARIASQREV